jgi:hypothetical protein
MKENYRNSFRTVLSATAFLFLAGAVFGAEKPADAKGVSKNNSTVAWDLVELRDRIDRVPYDKIRKDGVFLQSQRTIFHDMSFGGEIWKLTHQNIKARHYYSSVQAWNADGSILGIEAYPPNAKTKVHLIDADGNSLREFPYNKMKDLYPHVRFGYKVTSWDLKNPDIVYGMKKLTSKEAAIQSKLPKEQQSLMTPFYGCNIKTGKYWVVREVPIGFMDSTPFWYKGRQWTVIINRPYVGRDFAFTTISLDGKDMYKFPRNSFQAGVRADSIILTGMEDYPFFSASFIMSPDGNRANVDPKYLAAHPEEATGLVEKSVLKLGATGRRGRLTGGHSCYAYDGSGCIGVGTEITCVDYDKKLGYYKRRVVLASGGNGHMSWLNRDKRWVFPTLQPGDNKKNPYDGMLLKLASDSSEVVHRIAYHNSSYKEYSAEAHGSVSPDGTKMIFASDALGVSPKDVCSYIAVVKHPEPPVELKAEKMSNGAVKLAWKKPFNSVEHKGVYIYKSSQSGIGYEAVTSEPVAGESYVDAAAQSGKAAYYVATSVEHSGLESSRYSNEAVLNNAGPLRVFAEAEDGKYTLPCRTERDVTAVGEECMWFAVKDGSFSQEISLPLPGEYSLWVRHKNNSSAKLSIASAGNLSVTKTLEAGKGGWQWSKVTVKALKAGTATYVFNGSADLKIDRICLSGDPVFVPKDKGNGDQTPPGQVTALKVSEVTGHTAQLAWSSPSDKDIRYFNIYCSKKKGFTPEQKNLVWSPEGTAVKFLDYGLRGETEYFYRMTAVDRAGNESEPSIEVRIKTGAAEKTASSGDKNKEEEEKVDNP